MRCGKGLTFWMAKKWQNLEFFWGGEFLTKFALFDERKWHFWYGSKILWSLMISLSVPS